MVDIGECPTGTQAIDPREAGQKLFHDLQILGLGVVVPLVIIRNPSLGSKLSIYATVYWAFLEL